MRRILPASERNNRVRQCSQGGGMGQERRGDACTRTCRSRDDGYFRNRADGYRWVKEDSSFGRVYGRAIEMDKVTGASTPSSVKEVFKKYANIS